MNVLSISSLTETTVIIFVNNISIVKIERLRTGITELKLYLKYKSANEERNVKIMNTKDHFS